MSTHLSRDVGGEPIQIVPLRKGFVNLDTDCKVIDPRLVHCVTAGDIIITWRDGSTSTIALALGDYFAIDGAKSLAIGAATVIHAGGRLAGSVVPDAFSFIDLTDQVASTLITSDSITVAGIGLPVAISLTVGTGSYRINGGDWVDTAGTVEVGDTVELQQLSPALSTDPDAELTLDIGGVDDMWSVSTIA